MEYLADLIRIPSVSAMTNRPVVEYAAGVLRATGWKTRELPYRDADGIEKVNQIAAPPGQDPHDPHAELALMCHTDTVPYAAEWTRALNPLEAGGMLHGCGSCDVKAFLACVLAAAAEIEPLAHAPGLRVVLTADEEIGCVGASRLRDEDALRPRKMVIGEPTRLHPARAGKGYCLAEITVRGKEAHSAHPQQGASAIYAAAQMITAIEDLAREIAEERHGFFDPGFTTVNVGTIQGGTAKNIVPGLCRFQLEWRPVPGQPADRVLRTVSEIAAQVSVSIPGCRIEVQPVRQQAGFETSEDAALVRRMEELTGRSATSIPFGSEASIFAPIAEEVVVFGPGDMRTAHSSRECVPIAELHEAVRCLGALMRG